MILKSLPHKKTNFARVLDYVLRDYENRNDCFAVFHNLGTTDKKRSAREFLENYKLKDRRSNGNALYHEIMSFSPKDTPMLTVEKIEELTRKYIELRAANTLCVAALHRDTDHLHVHLVLSANEYLSSKAHRLSKEEFRKVHSEMERYQMERFPELEHSLVFQKDKKNEQENEKDERTKKGSNKERLTILMRSVFEQAKGLEDFLEKLEKENIAPYHYRGRLNGILHEGKKYRFKGLGILPEHIRTLERFDELNRLGNTKTDRDKDLGR